MIKTSKASPSQAYMTWAWFPATTQTQKSREIKTARLRWWRTSPFLKLTSVMLWSLSLWSAKSQTCTCSKTWWATTLSKIDCLLLRPCSETRKILEERVRSTSRAYLFWSSIRWSSILLTLPIATMRQWARPMLPLRANKRKSRCLQLWSRRVLTPSLVTSGT